MIGLSVSGCRGILPIGLGNYPEMDLGPLVVKQVVQFDHLAQGNEVHSGVGGDQRLITAARRVGAAASALDVDIGPNGHASVLRQKDVRCNTVLRLDTQSCRM